MSLPTLTLTNLADGSITPVRVLTSLSAAQVEAVEDVWLPFLLAAWQSRLQAGVRASALPEHKHWQWSQKARLYAGKSGYQFFALEAGVATQGLMLVNNISQCRLSNQAGDTMVYVDYVATAPWNLRSLSDTPRFRGVGKALIEVAAGLSRDNGMNGRLGLHSLPQAEAFYRDVCGMTDLGEDPNEYDLRYFEMTEAQAARFSSVP